LTDSAVENGTTFEENARIKAKHYAALSGLPTLADDSGLEVDALGGRPGIYTRRYAGSDATDEQNNRKLLTELADFYGPEERTARYQCVLIFVDAQAEEIVTRGTLEGRIAFEPRGTGGFGYDPVFEPSTEPIGGRTVAQVSASEKSEISHRGQAARDMRKLLMDRGFSGGGTTT
jgi:XTP/dITP diphosphohydrolase